MNNTKHYLVKLQLVDDEGEVLETAEAGVNQLSETPFEAVEETVGKMERRFINEIGKRVAFAESESE